MQLLRCVLVFLETQSWLRREVDPGDTEETSDDNSFLGALLSAVDYIISIFHAPLEAKGMCIASIQDELEEVVDYARKYQGLIDPRSGERACNSAYACRDGKMLVVTKNRIKRVGVWQRQLCSLR